MAALSDADRRDLWADFMSSETGAYGAMAKAQLRAAVDALDAWLDSQAATINAAIPQPARGAMTVTQKARLLAAVIRKRFDKGV